MDWRRATRQTADAIRELEKWQARPCAVCGHLGLLSAMVAVGHEPMSRVVGDGVASYVTMEETPSAWAHKACMPGSKYERREEG